MAKGPSIKPVANNKSKGKTYKALFDLYNSAINEGYFGEAELIVYAYMEDRLRSYIYYINGLERRNSSSIKPELADAIGQSGKTINISNISTKMQVVLDTYEACSKINKTNDAYIKELRKIYKCSVNITEAKSLFKKIDSWTKYRNEHVHAMFNKDLEDLRNGYKQHVDEGMNLARQLDKLVQNIKRA